MPSTQEGDLEVRGIQERSEKSHIKVGSEEWHQLHKEGLTLWKAYHEKLKKKAEKILKMKGYTVEKEVVIEVRHSVTVYSRQPTPDFTHSRRYRVDVLGKKDNKIVIIECGDSPRWKLAELSKYFEVFLLDWNGKLKKAFSDGNLSYLEKLLSLLF